MTIYELLRELGFILKIRENENYNPGLGHKRHKKIVSFVIFGSI
jgi:hypothetical protein